MLVVISEGSLQLNKIYYNENHQQVYLAMNSVNYRNGNG